MKKKIVTKKKDKPGDMFNKLSAKKKLAIKGLI